MGFIYRIRCASFSGALREGTRQKLSVKEKAISNSVKTYYSMDGFERDRHNFCSQKIFALNLKEENVLCKNLTGCFSFKSGSTVKDLVSRA